MSNATQIFGGDRRPIRALLFDVDGTLYRAGPLRRRMMLALVGHLCTRPWRAPKTIRNLRAYRRALEELRHEEPRDELEARHHQLASQLGADAESLSQDVEEWMRRRPLAYLRNARRPGLVEALENFVARGCGVGFFSDYPVRAKLEALGLSALLPAPDSPACIQLCAFDARLNALKPWPHGFALAARLWGLDPAEVVYVGDRVEVDAVGAAAAGMRSVLVGKQASDVGHTTLVVEDFDELRSRIESHLAPLSGD